jgi:hypothetical protein
VSTHPRGGSAPHTADVRLKEEDMNKREFVTTAFAVTGIVFVIVGIVKMFNTAIAYLFVYGVPLSQYYGNISKLVGVILLSGVPLLTLGAMMFWLRRSLCALVLLLTKKDEAEQGSEGTSSRGRADAPHR